MERNPRDIGFLFVLFMDDNHVKLFVLYGGINGAGLAYVLQTRENKCSLFTVTMAFLALFCT